MIFLLLVLNFSQIEELKVGSISDISVCSNQVWILCGNILYRYNLDTKYTDTQYLDFTPDLMIGRDTILFINYYTDSLEIRDANARPIKKLYYTGNFVDADLHSQQFVVASEEEISIFSNYQERLQLSIGGVRKVAYGLDRLYLLTDSSILNLSDHDIRRVKILTDQPSNFVVDYLNRIFLLFADSLLILDYQGEKITSIEGSYQKFAVSPDGENIFFTKDDRIFIFKSEPVGELPPSPLIEDPNPQPLGRSSSITYFLPRAMRITLSIYNIIGRSIRKLDGGYRSQGEHRIVWDGKDDDGKSVPNGIYFFRLKTPVGVYTKSITVYRK